MVAKARDRASLKCVFDISFFTREVILRDFKLVFFLAISA